MFPSEEIEIILMGPWLYSSDQVDYKTEQPESLDYHQEEMDTSYLSRKQEDTDSYPPTDLDARLVNANLYDFVPWAGLATPPPHYHCHSRDLVLFSPTANLMVITLHVYAGPTLVNMGKGMALGQFLHDTSLSNRDLNPSKCGIVELSPDEYIYKTTLAPKGSGNIVEDELERL
ncbi:hypothetical protein STEG23_019789 [Scotinomys teguina]